MVKNKKGKLKTYHVYLVEEPNYNKYKVRIMSDDFCIFSWDNWNGYYGESCFLYPDGLLRSNDLSVEEIKRIAEKYTKNNHTKKVTISLAFSFEAYQHEIEDASLWL